MMPVIATLLAVVVAGASAVVGLPQPSDICCFGLNSTGVVAEPVEEDHVGGLILGGSFQQGGFCFDKLTKTIKDTLNHHCFMRGPSGQFQCYAGIVGATAFDIWRPDPKGMLYLTYDGGPGTFYACSVGVGVDKYYNIFSATKPDTTNCVAVSLSLYDPTSGCLSAINSTAAAPTLITKQSTADHWSTRTREQGLSTTAATTTVTSSYGQVSSAALWSSKSPDVDESTASTSTYTEHSIGPVVGPTHVCSVSPSAPSLAPVKLSWFDKSSPDHAKGNSANVSIIPAINTTFLYNIPQSFLLPVSDGKMPLCGLQFRMPFCTELPKGYPCYLFSGDEQEELSESGMNFDLILDDGQATWNGTELHQIFPGDKSILGTFECGAATGSYAGRQMSWSVSSVHHFGLEFLHAGVGSDAKFQDGIGAWIVPCQ